MTITLEHGPYFTFIIRSQTGMTRLVQHDTDFPGVASAFGWGGSRAETPEAIWEAHEFLEEHVGVTADDPGYF